MGSPDPCAGFEVRERCSLSNERKELSFDAVFLTYTFALVTFLRIEVTQSTSHRYR
jgi:hypothetical protein